MKNLYIVCITLILLNACSNGTGRKSTYSGSNCPEGQTIQTIGNASTCVPLVTDTTECKVDADCASGYFCASDNTCELNIGMCETNSDCSAGYHCVAKSCVLVATSECASHGDCQSTEFCDLGSDPKLCLNKKPYDTVCSVAYCSNFCRSSVTYTINNQKKCGCTADTQTTDCGSGKNCGTLTNNLNRCVAIIQFNGSCTDLTTTQCASNLSCVNSKCKKNDGQTCSAAADCVSNYCNSSKVCAQSVGACNGDPVKSWQGGLNGHICATTSQGCCKSGLCPDGKCGCYSHMDCASASYCQLSTGLCIAGCTDQLPDGNGVTTSVCPTNYYCADGNICRIRCDHTSPAYQCGNTGQFCDRGPGVCINKLLYGDAIPTGVTATEACISNKAQAGTSVCGCDPNVAGYCSANVSGTSYCDTADNKCKTGCTNNSQCTVSSTPYCDVKGIMGKPKQCVAASLLQQKCDANVPCAPIAGMSCASYSGSPSYCKMSRDYNCNSDGDCVNSCIGTGNCSDGGDQCCAKLSSNKTCRDWCLR